MILAEDIYEREQSIREWEEYKGTLDRGTLDKGRLDMHQKGTLEQHIRKDYIKPKE